MSLLVKVIDTLRYGSSILIECICTNYIHSIVSPGPGTTQSTDGNDTVIIVSAAIGGSVLLLALVLCFIVIWCCLIKNNPKRVHLRRARHTNYKGNSPYVLPYTIYGM